jgi:hypothetical protein
VQLGRNDHVNVLSCARLLQPTGEGVRPNEYRWDAGPVEDGNDVERPDKLGHEEPGSVDRNCQALTMAVPSPQRGLVERRNCRPQVIPDRRLPHGSSRYVYPSSPFS